MAVASLGAAAAVTFSMMSNQGSGFTECEDVSHANQMTKVSSKPDVSMLDPNILDDERKPMRKRMETYVKLLQRRLVDLSLIHI